MKYVDGFACPLAVQAWCFPSSLTPSDWAAWVQAVGSIVALIGAGCIGWYQAARQHRTAMAAAKHQRALLAADEASTWSKLAKQCTALVKYASGRLGSRDAISAEAEDESVANVARGMEQFTQEIAVFHMRPVPHELMHEATQLQLLVRETKNRVADALARHRTLDSAAFDEFIEEMNKLLAESEKLCDHIEAVRVRLRADADALAR